MKEYVEGAWKSVKAAYESSHINSERTLQAHIFSQLTTSIPSSCLVICEPIIDLERVGRVIPDMLVLEGEFVTAVVEFKFVPHHYPIYGDDLEKLQAYAKATDRFPLLLNPTSGQFDSRLFTFSPQCLLVFGVVGRGDSDALNPVMVRSKMPGLEERFLYLPLGVPS